MFRNFFILFSCLFITQIVSAQKWIEFKNESISLSIPEGWQTKDTMNAFFVISPMQIRNPDFIENISINIMDLKANPMTIDQLTDAGITQIKAVNPNNSEVVSEKVSFAGQDARKVKFKVIQDETHTFWVSEFWFVLNNGAFFFTYMTDENTYSKNELIADKIIKSFKFVTQ